MEYIIDRKWKWVQCNLVIKRLPQRQNQQGLYQSLEAQVQLISQESDIRNFQSQITMEKGFQFEEGKGYIWHKSWYIPQIVVKLSPKITKMLRQQNHIKKIYCQMLSGYPFKKDQHFYLEEIKLQGETVRQFNKKGQVSFSNVKFAQTSFNKNKNKFSLIMAIYTTYKQNQKTIIKSYISSPIHVDSRKQARKKISATTFIQDEINISKFLHPLQGAEKLMSQNFTYMDLLTINGFIKYYTAANIRFKIKHPYYIGYHFSDVFDVYYNEEEASDPVNVLDLIYENELRENDRAKAKPKNKKQIFTDNKEILKKMCPKLLLFLIKNTPKQCYLIKEEGGIQDEKGNPQKSLVKFQALEDSKNQKSNEQIQQHLRDSKEKVKDSKQIVQNFQNQESKLNILRRQGQNLQIQGVNIDQNKISQEKRKDSIEPNYENQFKKFPLVPVPTHQIKQEQNSSVAIDNKVSSQNQAQDYISKKQQAKIDLLKQQEAIKKIYSIFESWKFNFVHLKKSDGGLTILNKKWVHIPKEELFQSFKTYSKKIATNPNKGATNASVSNIDARQMVDKQQNANNYENYELHQVIVLQKGRNQVKLQNNEEKDQQK